MKIFSLEIEKLQELKVLLSYKMISYKEYLDFFKFEFLTNKKGV